MTEHYSYRLTWSAEDDEYVATVAEFPSLSWLDEDSTAALQGLRQLVAQIVQDMEANGEAVPIAISDRSFSGKFQVRITPQLHRRLVTEATEQGVSLNHLVTTKLAADEDATRLLELSRSLSHLNTTIREASLNAGSVAHGMPSVHS